MEIIKVDFSEEELAIIEECAARHNTSVEEFIRNVVKKGIEEELDLCIGV